MTTYNDQASRYICELFAPEDQTLKQTAENITTQGLPKISVMPEEGKFLQFLARACGGGRVLEIGTLGGYSGIWIARGLPMNGKLITLEKDERHAEIARQHFQEAAVDDWIDIRVADAHEILPQLSVEGPFDMVFIDAEKPGYMEYYEWAVENVRRGGIIAIHNAFRKGSVFSDEGKDQWTDLQHEFNLHVANDLRVIATIYPAGDGTITAVVK